jgi:hypothetical protein
MCAPVACALEEHVADGEQRCAGEEEERTGEEGQAELGGATGRAQPRRRGEPEAGEAGHGPPMR